MKCAGAETILRAVIDGDEGVSGAIKRARWLAGQSPEYLQDDLGDSCQVLMRMCLTALDAKRGAGARA